MGVELVVYAVDLAQRPFNNTPLAHRHTIDRAHRVDQLPNSRSSILALAAVCHLAEAGGDSPAMGVAGTDVSFDCFADTVVALGAVL